MSADTHTHTHTQNTAMTKSATKERTCATRRASTAVAPRLYPLVVWEKPSAVASGEHAPNGPVPPVPRIRAEQTASDGRGRTAYLDLSGQRPGLCSRAASRGVCRSDNRGWWSLDTCRMSSRGMLVSCRPGPAETLGFTCVPCFGLSRLQPRHPIIRCEDSPHGSLEY